MLVLSQAKDSENDSLLNSSFHFSLTILLIGRAEIFYPLERIHGIRLLSHPERTIGR